MQTVEPRLRRNEFIPEISSSQEQEQSSLTLRGGRNIAIVNVTSFVTSFVFITMAVKTNVILGNGLSFFFIGRSFLLTSYEKQI